MSTRTIRVGSRESALAVAQSRLVMETIRRAHPELELELVTMKTTGDRILDRTLEEIGGKGLFVKELDAALRAGEVDLTVHSCKDLPMDLPEDLPLAAFSAREDPRDVLVLPEGIGCLDRLRPIGCASARRRVQLAGIFPGREIAPVRGNVLTRLRKLDEGQFSALVLAGAGLKRLGLAERIGRYFAPEELIPAAGQGILAVQVRAGTDASFLDCVNDQVAADCARAERAFVRRLDGGCTAPVAAYAVVSGDQLRLTGLYEAEDGGVVRGSILGARDRGEALAEELAQGLKEGRI